MSKASNVMATLFDIEVEPEPDPLWGDRLNELARERERMNRKPYGRPEPEPEVIDQVTARAFTRAAIKRADEHANPNWKQVFMRTLINVAVDERTFTTDAIWQRLQNNPHVPKTHERRAAGSLVIRAAKAGLIRLLPNQFRTSERAHCHGSLLRVYESKIHGKDPTQFYGLVAVGIA